MSTATLSHITPEEYLALERNAEFKSEYIDGHIIAMSPGGSFAHNYIAGNIYAGLLSRFAGRGCHAFMSDVKVRFGPGTNYTYPDVVALCGTPRSADEFNDTLINPTMIVEVLSPSTKTYDQTDKLVRYQTIESLREYVLVSQDEVRVEHHTRFDLGWGVQVQTDLEAEIELGSVGCRFTLREIYARTRFVEAGAKYPSGSPLTPG